MPDIFRNRLKRYNGICDIVMGLITVDKDIITLINVFTVDPSKQKQLVDALVETTKQVWRLQDGNLIA